MLPCICRQRLWAWRKLKESQLDIKVEMFSTVIYFQLKTLNVCHLEELVSPECWSSRAKDCSWVPYQVNHLQVVLMSSLWSLVPPLPFWKSYIYGFLIRLIVVMPLFRSLVTYFNAFFVPVYRSSGSRVQDFPDKAWSPINWIIVQCLWWICLT